MHLFSAQHHTFKPAIIAWERKLMEGPFIHHAAMTYGHFANALKEAVKYNPNLELLELDSIK